MVRLPLLLMEMGSSSVKKIWLSFYELISVALELACFLHGTKEADVYNKSFEHHK